VDDDMLNGHDWVYKRDNIIQFTDKPEYVTELEKKLWVKECPPDHRATVRDPVVEFWDCFTQDSLRFPIRGFEFVVDTGM
jgi:hypothetical protein